MRGVLIAFCLLPAGVLAMEADPLAEASIAIFATDAGSDPLPAEATLTLFPDDDPTPRLLDLPQGTADSRGSITLAAGYRHEALRFNIASDLSGKKSPNILSELKWRVPMAELRLSGEWTHHSGFAIEGSFAWAHGLAGGKVRDSDYLRNNRQLEFSRSYADPDHSTAHDVSLGAGWRFPLGGRARLSALAGYALNQTDFSMRNGRQIISLPPQNMPLGKFSGLDSSYSTRWRGPWVALKGETLLGRQFTLYAGISHHWLKLKADADWNLRGDRAHPISFSHTGSGNGWSAQLGTRWQFARDHEITLDLAKRRFAIDDGRQTNYFADGNASTLRLNEVRTSSWSAAVGYRFFY